MSSRLDPIAELATSAARGALPEIVTVGDATVLPRGADPFIGSQRPMLLCATRWAAVSPGGVLVGGTPAGLAAMFGFDLPEKPVPSAVPRAQGSPPPPRWQDLIAEAARPSLTTFSHAIANAVATLSGLPPECAETQITLNDSDSEVRTEVGPISDAVVLLLHAGEHEARVVIVVPGVFLARMIDPVGDAEVMQTKGETMARPVVDGDEAAVERRAHEPLQAALAKVPLDLSIELGRTRVPLAQILHLSDGEVIELWQAIDAPVDLVSEGTAVARGDLEVDGVGNLVMHITSIPGRKPPGEPPRLVADVPVGAPSATAVVDPPQVGEADAGTDPEPADRPGVADEPDPSGDAPATDAPDEPVAEPMSDDSGDLADGPPDPPDDPGAGAPG